MGVEVVLETRSSLAHRYRNSRPAAISIPLTPFPTSSVPQAHHIEGVASGFIGALRRSELVALDFKRVKHHLQGLVGTTPRFKTNQEAIVPDLVVLPSEPNVRAAPQSLPLITS